MGKVLGLTKNNEKYADVPDRLKWAIPIHESVSRPEIKFGFKMLAAKVAQKIAQEVARRKRSHWSKLDER